MPTLDFSLKAESIEELIREAQETANTFVNPNMKPVLASARIVGLSWGMSFEGDFIYEVVSPHDLPV